MPLNALEVDAISKASIDHYLKNKPVDQINVDRPLLDDLLTDAKDIGGGKEFIVASLFKSNDSNFQNWSGNGQVTYNTRNPLEKASFRWANGFEGFTVNEDELYRAGIEVNDDKGKSTSNPNEVVAFANYLEARFQAIENGFKDGLHKAVWFDGTQSADATEGIDALVSTSPSSGSPGLINASTNTWWQNGASTGLASTLTALQNALELNKRKIRRTGGAISKIYAGGDMIDALRTAVAGANQTQVNYQGGSKLSIDLATDTLKFDGVKIEWVPDFDTNFGAGAPAIPWAKRLYMLDRRFIKLHKASNDFMKLRYPGRPIDSFVYHYGMTGKYGLVCSKRNAHAVMSLS